MTPDSEDYQLFWSLARSAPNNISFEKQIDFVVNKAKEKRLKNIDRKKIQRANFLAAKAGLIMTPDSEDYQLFWSLAQNAPHNFTFEKQVDFVVNKVNEKRKTIDFSRAFKPVQPTREEWDIIKDMPLTPNR